jgi:hypothetical protein
VAVQELPTTSPDPKEDQIMAEFRTCIRGLVIAAVALACISTLRAGPTDEMLGKHKEQLEKKIQIQFLDVPLDRAMDSLQREAGIPFVMDKKNLGSSLTDTVRLPQARGTARL